jgi:integrase
VKTAADSMHGDGGGLYLAVSGNRRRWVFRFTRARRKREMGLGSAASVSLASAREAATEARAAVARGEDPIAGRTPSQPAPAPAAPRLMTFRQAADNFLLGHAPTLSNRKHRAQWQSTLDTYAAPLMDRPCGEIAAADVHDVLTPIWLEKMETASRVRQRIEKVLAFADAREDRDRSNPAALKGKLGFLLPAQKNLHCVKHHPAVPVSGAPGAFARLWVKRDAGIGYAALVAAILSGLRSGEVRRLEWDDLHDDWEGCGGPVIAIPASRMKARREQVLPLTPMLKAHIAAQPGWADSRLIFPGQQGQPMSDMTLAQAMRRSALGDYTVHGWRSTLRDWAGREGWPRERAELQLAHQVGSAVERAYARDSLVDARRAMMLVWEQYLAGGPSAVREAAE